MSKPITFKKGDLIDEDDSIVIWPEWSEAEVLAEKWGGKHVFEDGESLVLPRCIRKHYDSQKRASDIAGDSTSIVIVQPTTLDDLLLQNAILIPDLSLKQIEDPISEKIFETIVDVDSLSQGTSKLIVQNKHLLSSDFFLNLLSCIHYCYENNKIAKQTGSGEEFLPWDNIYPKAKDGLPAYNPSGKYMIKLFWLGTWRKIVVDDRIPVDVNGKPLLLSSTSSHEIWPLLLSKALMKLAHSSVTDESEVSEFGDFDIFTALRGWIPESLTFSPLQGMMAINTITAIWDPKKLEPVESEASSVSSPPATKAILKPVTPTIFLYRHQSEATKLDVNTLSIVYRIAEIQEVPESNTKEFLIRPYFSAGSKTSENADQWISEQMLCQVFDRAVVYHHPQHYRVTKSVMNIFDPAKVNENLKPIHVLYVPEESVDAGVIAMLCTHSKPGGSSSYGVNTVVLIEECQLAGTLQKKPVIRMCSNGYSGFFFKPQPGVGYRISFESSSSYSLNLYSKDEFVVEDEVKYLTEKHGFKVKEFEDVLPAQVAGSWAILFKHIVTVTDTTTMLCCLSYPESMSLCTSLHAINNDTGLELDSFAPLATQTLLPNKDGYTIFAQCRSLQAKPATKWKFRLYSSHVLGEKDYLSTKMNVQDFAETYVPNKHNILFRNIVKVKDSPMNLASFHAQFSYPSIWIKLQLFDNETEIASTQGKGSVVLPHIPLYISDDPVPQKPSKEDKKRQSTSQQSIMPKHKYVVQATILSSEVEKLHSASSETNRPNSRNIKSANSATKKKRSATVVPQTPPANISSGGNSSVATPAAVPEVEFSWSLRVIGSETVPLSVQKDTEKEDRYKTIKESWEAAAPGRMNRAKETRELYLKGVEAGTVKPLTLSHNDQILKPWSTIKKECPKVLLKRERDIRTPEQKLSLLQKLLTKTSTVSLVTPEVKEELPSFSVQCSTIGIADSPIVLESTDLEEQIQIRVQRMELNSENQAENIRNRQQEKERRGMAKKKVVEMVELKLRELEYWNKVDKDRREEYKQKVLLELEESNARLRAALDAQAKAAESLEQTEEQSEKKKKVGKK